MTIQTHTMSDTKNAAGAQPNCNQANKATESNIAEEILNLPINLITGEVLTLKQLQGQRPVYVKFWTSWCTPCREQMAHFEQIKWTYGDDLMVIGINLGISDDVKTVHQAQQEFGLTMPLAIDSDGALTHAFKVKGTPYHLLFDKQMNLVFTGHDTNTTLDKNIAALTQPKWRSETTNASSKVMTQESINALTVTAKTNDDLIHSALGGDQTHLILLTSTWAHWYIKETRPETAAQAIKAQQLMNRLAKLGPKLNAQTVVSRLWTGDNELAAFTKKFDVQHSIQIDVENDWFHHFKVTDLPVLVVVRNGRERFRLTDFTDTDWFESYVKSI